MNTYLEMEIDLKRVKLLLISCAVCEFLGIAPIGRLYTTCPWAQPGRRGMWVEQRESDAKPRAPQILSNQDSKQPSTMGEAIYGLIGAVPKKYLRWANTNPILRAFLNLVILQLMQTFYI